MRLKTIITLVILLGVGVTVAAQSWIDSGSGIHITTEGSVYQAIGAASESASRSNLIGGVGDLGTTNPPAWDASTGWTFDGNDDAYYFRANDGTKSGMVFVRLDWPPQTQGTLYGYGAQGDYTSYGNFRLDYLGGGVVRCAVGGKTLDTTVSTGNVVIACGNTNPDDSAAAEIALFVNGQRVSGATLDYNNAPGVVHASYGAGVGCGHNLNDAGAHFNYTQMTMQAVAAIQEPLSDLQIHDFSMGMASFIFYQSTPTPTPLPTNTPTPTVTPLPTNTATPTPTFTPTPTPTNTPTPTGTPDAANSWGLFHTTDAVTMPVGLGGVHIAPIPIPTIPASQRLKIPIGLDEMNLIGTIVTTFFALLDQYQILAVIMVVLLAMLALSWLYKFVTARPGRSAGMDMGGLIDGYYDMRAGNLDPRAADYEALLNENRSRRKRWKKRF